MRRWLLPALAAALLSACVAPGLPPPAAAALPAQPEAATGLVAKPGWQFQRQAVAAAHPLAAEAGLAMLRAGGTAVDAAVAVQMVLNVVEPQSSGIGGGAFLLHWDGREVQAWDGRETAPAAADERLFLQPDGRPRDHDAATLGGRPVGVPGVVRLLEAAHRAHGRLPWAQLFQPAIRLAEHGFTLGPRLQAQLQGATALRQDRLARALFYTVDGQALPAGTRLRNPALAEVLRRIAAEGSAALHTGPLAADIVRRVRGHAGAPGALSEADLAGYQALPREPICTDWGLQYRVCGMPPPSSGHLALMQILGILERLPAAPADPLAAAPAAPADVGSVATGPQPGADWLHAYAEASRLAFADRAQHVADPDFTDPPAGGWGSLLEDAYLRQRAGLVGERSMGRAPAGQPGPNRSAWAPQVDQPERGTSHFSIVDAQGRAVAMTSSIEQAFGAQLMSDGGTGLPGGFLLNNQLTDFSLRPADEQGRPVANRLQPGKRPRSSMAPTLVFNRHSGQLLASLGSPGGPAIIHFNAKALLGMLAWGLDAQRAIDLPNFGNFNSPTLLEAGRFSPASVAALKARGHQVVETDLPSGLQALRRRPGGGWEGGADPRREGWVVGD